MARERLPEYNASLHGQGAEGAANYANILVDNLLFPFFLLVFWAGAIFVWSKSDKNMGSGVFFISLVCFLMALMAQTFTLFMQIVIFVFFVGIITGIVLYFTE